MLAQLPFVDVLHLIIIPMTIILRIIIIYCFVAAGNYPVDVDHAFDNVLVRFLSNLAEIFGVRNDEGHCDGVDPRIEEPY